MNKHAFNLRVSIAAATLAISVFVSAAPAAAAPASPSQFGLFHPPHAIQGAIPTPDDTLEVTATEPYGGVHGSGRAYVLLAPGHTAITDPIVVVEGFDLDDAMDFDELYTLLNQEALVESLLARGHDAVVLDFASATDPIQRNAFVFTALLAQVDALLAPGVRYPVVGASMGALVARYGLAWLETQGAGHRVHTFVSFDGPQRGANIPLGLQHWVEFFAAQSADAATFRAILESPAARQMLLYHFTATSGSTAAADPLRTAFLADLAAVGEYPQVPRRVAFANGTGDGAGQGYAPAAQLIEYGYNNFIVIIDGDVRAVPGAGTANVFVGRIRILFVSDTQRTVTVTGGKAWDGAPGGWRASMAQLADTQAPYGDIVALHERHAFIPTVSALDLPDDDPFLAVSALPDPAALSPFDALWWAPTNEEHVFISPVTAERLLLELQRPVVDVPGAPVLTVLQLAPARPNPARSGTRFTFGLAQAGEVAVEILDVRGRNVRTLLREARGAGAHDAAWDLRDDAGRRVPAGVYLVRVAAGQEAVGRRFVVLP